MAVPSALARVCLTAVLLTAVLPTVAAASCPRPAPPGRLRQRRRQLQLGCPSFPNTSPKAQPEWDYFAWNSFVAANWPAVVPKRQPRAARVPGPRAELRDRRPRHPARLGDLQGEAGGLRPGEHREPGAVEPGSGLRAGRPVHPPVRRQPGRRRLAAALLRPGPENRLRQSRRDGRGRLRGPGAGRRAVRRPPEIPQCGTPQQKHCCSVHAQAVGPRVWKGSPTKPRPAAGPLRGEGQLRLLQLRHRRQPPATTSMRRPRRPPSGRDPASLPDERAQAAVAGPTASRRLRPRSRTPSPATTRRPASTPTTARSHPPATSRPARSAPSTSRRRGSSSRTKTRRSTTPPRPPSSRRRTARRA